MAASNLHLLHPQPAARRAQQDERGGGLGTRVYIADLDPAVRSTRQAGKLKFPNDRIQKRVREAGSRLVRCRDALGALNEADTHAGTVSRSRAPAFRGRAVGAGGTTVVLGGRP